MHSETCFNLILSAVYQNGMTWWEEDNESEGNIQMG